MTYSVDYLPANVVEALRGSHQLGIFMNIQTDPALHLWFGVNDIPARIDSVDEDGPVYLGAGYLNGLPTLETQINGTSDSIELPLSGLTPATGSSLLSSTPAVRGCEIYIGITTLDEYYQPMSSIVPIWQGKGSHTSVSSPSVSGTDNRTVSISLTCTTGSDTRSRPSYALWSHAQFQAEHPGDDFCKQTSRLARGVQPAWPNY
ncbi:hypothetical protein [Agrobacterium vitis]|uniref:hypothetical protein n=1 Tax=Agrobacterium vitis TaxID=373 RepID=UPI0008FB1B3C|nr:hypothetical protein [Agrobacterium vitis]OHZ30856.1 hypothetical protein BBL07_22595 [Agrobacterium vitis]